MISQAQPVHCTPTSYNLVSFLQSLVTTNLQPVLQSDEPTPSASRPSWFTNDELTALIEKLKPEIARMAWRFSQRLLSISVDPDDLEQEGLTAAWQAATRYDPSKAKDERSLSGYCIIRARGAMVDYLRREFKKLAADSLDAYLEVDTDDGHVHREIADTPVEHRQATRTERRRILAALDKLTQKERLLVMSHFHIESRDGEPVSPRYVQTRYGLSDKAVYNDRARALKKLARLM